jgi:hypothetical protein
MRNAIKTFGLVSALVLSACGGDKGDDLGRFVGTWQPTSGTMTEICGGYVYTDTVTTSETWQAGLTSDLVSTDVIGGCAVEADVNGSTASGTPGKTCASPDGSQTVTIHSYAFVISPDGHTATENASGNIVLIASGATVPCSFNVTAAYQKIGR